MFATFYVLRRILFIVNVFLLYCRYKKTSFTAFSSNSAFLSICLVFLSFYSDENWTSGRALPQSDSHAKLDDFRCWSSIGRISSVINLVYVYIDQYQMTFVQITDVAAVHERFELAKYRSFTGSIYNQQMSIVCRDNFFLLFSVFLRLVSVFSL